MTDEILHIMIEAHRHLRHDFMNYIQVISGYLQIGQVEKALEYSKKTARDMEIFHPLAKIGLPLLESFFLSYLTFLNSSRNCFHFQIETDLSRWQEDDYLITMLMKDLLYPLREDIIRKELEFHIRITSTPILEIKALCSNNMSADKIVEMLHKLNVQYRESMKVEVREKTDDLILFEINKRTK